MYSKYFSFLNKVNKREKNIESETNAELSKEEIELNLIKESELFDAEWYLSTNPDLKEMDEDPLIHFYYHGWKEGRWPCYLFDPTYYLKKNNDVKVAGLNPLFHYINWGEGEGRTPSLLFESYYYEKQNPEIQGAKTCLGHYIKIGWTLEKSPHTYFDTKFYLENNPDIKEAGIDPFYHFLFQGFKEGRNPHPQFDIQFYKQKYLSDEGEDVNPFLHFIEYGRQMNYSTHEQNSFNGTVLFSELKKYHSPSEKYEDPIKEPFNEFNRLAKTIAFYLPQFHTFEENDEWWGKGFTEWRNVTRGLPRFSGHFQPRLPRDLGYYDLNREEVIQQQIELAKNAGLFGFCFYYYSFNGKRLLDLPLDNFLNMKGNDFPFCIMWANENWTRTWDGMEANVLIKQEYEKQDDDLFVKDIVKHFKKKNYIRVGDQPLFIIYRPGVIPDAKERIEDWRERFNKFGEDPLIYMVQGFGDNNPNKFGLDGAIEFPPHKLVNKMSHINQSLDVSDPDFSGTYFSYDDLIEVSNTEEKDESFDIIRTVVPDWDNEARRPGRGMGFVGSTPAKFGDWLSSMIDFSIKNPVKDESFVFINAWNEWAEGAYMEPDVHWGGAYLNAARKAVSGVKKLEGKFRIAYFGHDAYKHGAQLLSLNIVKTLVQEFGIEVHLFLLEGGPLVEEYQKVCNTIIIDHDPQKLESAIRDLSVDRKLEYAICNTVVTGEISHVLKKNNVKTVHLIHELENLIKERGFQHNAKEIKEYANK